MQMQQKLQKVVVWKSNQDDFLKVESLKAERKNIP
jgi:hypothetical protein